jgi:hypothetical protein
MKLRVAKKLVCVASDGSTSYGYYSYITEFIFETLGAGRRNAEKYERYDSRYAPRRETETN